VNTSSSRHQSVVYQCLQQDASHAAHKELGDQNLCKKTGKDAKSAFYYCVSIAYAHKTPDKLTTSDHTLLYTLQVPEVYV
jgi:hypothetical protein